MTANKLLAAIFENPMQSCIVTSMSSTNIATNHKRVKDKLKYVESRDNQLTASLAELMEEKIPLEAERLNRLAELERATKAYNEVKEEVDVLNSVMKADKSDIMEYRVARSDLGMLVDVLQILKDAPYEERPFGKIKARPIEQIRASVGCPTPESCFKLSYRKCVAINHVFLGFGYFTHPTFTGLWKIPPNGDMRAWIDLYDDTPRVKTRKANSLQEMQRRIHDYLAFVAPKDDSPSDVHVVRDVKDIPTDVLALLSAEYELRMQSDTSRHEDNVSPTPVEASAPMTGDTEASAPMTGDTTNPSTH